MCGLGEGDSGKSAIALGIRHPTDYQLGSLWDYFLELLLTRAAIASSVSE
jgi:hypothetical protein